MTPTATQNERRLKGLPVSEGFAVARVCMFNERQHTNLASHSAKGPGADGELARLQSALETVRNRLDLIAGEVEKRVGSAEAGIFLAQRMILEDPSLQAKVSALIRAGRDTAETAVVNVLDDYEARLLALDNEYIKERASDFGELKRRILDTLGNMNPNLICADESHCQKGKNRIVAAGDLTPTLTMELDTDHLLGLVTERGGYNSHGAILARALGVPAVSGLRGIRDILHCGTELLINGSTGDVILWPGDETIAEMSATFSASLRSASAVDPVPGFTVMANVRTASDIPEALRMKAEGIGLYRTEIDLIKAGRPLTEDELYQTYLSAVEAAQGSKIIFRMFDLGSDKKAPFLAFPDEENPALGWRGARFLLGNLDLLRAQARALARLSRHAQTYLMYPMVVDLEQFLRLRAAFDEAVAGLSRGTIHQGVMFEVPSACIEADKIMKEAGFASVGTNDLAQYLFAVDRNNERVAADFTCDKPVFWSMLRSLVDAAGTAGKPLSVCGEMGGDPRYTARLIEAGIRTVSVSARRISVARAAAAAVLHPPRQ